MKDINLLPEDIKATVGENTVSSRTSAKLSSVTILVIILVSIIAIAILFAPHFIIKSKEATVEAIKAQINSQAYQEVKAVNGQLSTINSTLNGKYAVLKDIDNSTYPVNELLNEVKQAVPNGCVVSSLKFDNGRVLITGAATDSMVIAEFISNIDRLDIFNRAGLTDSVSYQRTNSVQRFQLSFTVGRKDGK